MSSWPGEGPPLEGTLQSQVRPPPLCQQGADQGIPGRPQHPGHPAEQLHGDQGGEERLPEVQQAQEDGQGKGGGGGEGCLRREMEERKGKDKEVVEAVWLGRGGS